MTTGQSRRALAKVLGRPDVRAKIPDARWTRTTIFERLCHDHAFVGDVQVFERIRWVVGDGAGVTL